MRTEVLIFVYVVCLLTGIGAVAILEDLRRRRFGPEPSEDRVFRCERCGYVYTDDPDVDRSRCPQCRTLNGMVKF
jgi:rubrerythrin